MNYKIWNWNVLLYDGEKRYWKYFPVFWIFSYRLMNKNLEKFAKFRFLLPPFNHFCFSIFFVKILTVILFIVNNKMGTKTFQKCFEFLVIFFINWFIEVLVQVHITSLFWNIFQWRFLQLYCSFSTIIWKRIFFFSFLFKQLSCFWEIFLGEGISLGSNWPAFNT